MEMLKECISGLVSVGKSLIGMIIQLKHSTSKATKRKEQELKKYESELSKKVYVSSKRADMEFEIYYKLNQNCGEILLLMQRLYPDKLSTYQINYEEKPDLNELALKIRAFRIEINNSRAFVSSEIISLYNELLNNAEKFFVDADKHNLCWDDSKEDHERKTELRDVAYESRVTFEDNWKKASERVNKYLCCKE